MFQIFASDIFIIICATVPVHQFFCILQLYDDTCRYQPLWVSVKKISHSHVVLVCFCKKNDYSVATVHLYQAIDI